MLVIPAIDLKNGKCVRLKQGLFYEQTVYSELPAEVALYFQSVGAQRLHIVDLDGAETGVSKNRRVVEKILSRCELPVQLGGGIRTVKNIEDWLARGIDRVVIGTMAITSPEQVKQLLARFGGTRIILAVDARDGRVAIQGWQQISKLNAVDLALDFKKNGLMRILYTDIDRDGMFTGPNFEFTKEIARKTKLKVTASGGISSIKDLQKLTKLEQYGVDSVIVGKAFYERKILPEEVFDAR